MPFVEKFIKSVFDKTIEQRKKINKKMLASDPQLKAAEEELSAAFANLEKVVERQKRYK